MIERYRDGVVPDAEPAAELATSSTASRRRCPRTSTGRLTAGARRDLAAVKLLNRYVQDEQPWQLAKDDARPTASTGALRLAEGLRVVSVLLHPFMPDSAERLLAALGAEDLARRRCALGAVAAAARSRSSASSSPGRAAERSAA